MKNNTGALIKIFNNASGFYLRSKINSSLKIANIPIEDGYYIITHFIQNDDSKHLIEILYNNNLVMLKFSEENCSIILN